MKRLLFVYNPNAGKGQVRKYLSTILERLGELDYEMVIRPTRRQGDATRIVRENAGDCELLVCSGGDGTLNETIDGLMRRQAEGLPVPVLGYIPAGTVNDFATSLNLPKDPEAAVRVIMDGKKFRPDFGSIESASGKTLGHFTYIAGFGAFTEVSYETPQTTKNSFGKVAYFVEAAKRLPDIRPIPMQVYYEDQMIEGDFLYGMVTNSLSVGGFKGITGKGVLLDDGKFDVILVRMPKKPSDLQNTINSLLVGEWNNASICHFHTDRVTFDSSKSVPWVLDGESGGAHHRLTIQNHQQALEIMVPANYGDQTMDKKKKKPEKEELS